MEDQNGLLPWLIYRRLFDRLPEMKRNISLEKHFFLDLLCQENVISGEELEQIRIAENNEDRVHNLIAIISRASCGKYHTFRQCLINTGQKHIVVNILDKDRPLQKWRICCRLMVQVIVIMFATLYKSMQPDPRLPIAISFREKYGQIPQWASPDAWRVSADKMYTPVTLVNINSDSTELEKKGLNDYHNHLIKDGDRVPLYVVLSGESGIGKSTFIRKLAYTWAKYVIDQSSVDSETRRVMQQFDYMLPLRLRDLQPNDTFESFLRNQFTFLNPDLLDNLVIAVANDHHKILCILDDYEMTENASKEIIDIIKRNYIPYSFNVLITTREFKVEYLRDHIGTTGREAVMTGFNITQIQDFIDKCYKGNQSSKSSLIKSVKSNKAMRELARNPLNLQLICAVSSSEPTDLHHRPTLYLEFLLSKLRRHHKEKKRVEDRVTGQELLDIYKEPLRKLGRLGFTGCNDEFTAMTNLIFSLECVEKMVDKEALSLGLLVSNMPKLIKHQRMVEFFHESFQYFIVALGYHLGNVDLLEEIRDKMSLGGSSASTLQFLAGLNPSMANDLMQYRMDMIQQVIQRTFYEEIQCPYIQPAQFEFYGPVLKGFKSLREAKISFAIISLTPFVFRANPFKETVYDYLELGDPETFRKLEILFIDLAIREWTIYQQTDVLKNWNSRLLKILRFAFRSPSLKHIYMWPAERAVPMLKIAVPMLPSAITLSYSCDKESKILEPTDWTLDTILYETMSSTSDLLPALARLHIEGVEDLSDFFRVINAFPNATEVVIDLEDCNNIDKNIFQEKKLRTTGLKWKPLTLLIPLTETIETTIITVLKHISAMKYVSIKFTVDTVTGVSMYHRYLAKKHATLINYRFPDIEIHLPDPVIIEHLRRYTCRKGVYDKKLAESTRKEIEMFMME